MTEAIELAKIITNADWAEDTYGRTALELAKTILKLDAENAALRTQLAQGEPVDEIELRKAFEAHIEKRFTIREREYGSEILAFDYSKGRYASNVLHDKFECFLAGNKHNKARAALKPALPEGYQLVPALAADWPLEVGVKRLLRELSLNAHPRDVVYFTLIDMLAAAKDA